MGGVEDNKAIDSLLLMNIISNDCVAASTYLANNLNQYVVGNSSATNVDFLNIIFDGVYFNKDNDLYNRYYQNTVNITGSNLAIEAINFFSSEQEGRCGLLLGGIVVTANPHADFVNSAEISSLWVGHSIPTAVNLIKSSLTNLVNSQDTLKESDLVSIIIDGTHYNDSSQNFQYSSQFISYLESYLGCDLKPTITSVIGENDISGISGAKTITEVLGNDHLTTENQKITGAINELKNMFSIRDLGLPNSLVISSCSGPGFIDQIYVSKTNDLIIQDIQNLPNLINAQRNCSQWSHSLTDDHYITCYLNDVHQDGIGATCSDWLSAGEALSACYGCLGGNDQVYPG